MLDSFPTLYALIAIIYWLNKAKFHGMILSHATLEKQQYQSEIFFYLWWDVPSKFKLTGSEKTKVEEEEEPLTKPIGPTRCNLSSSSMFCLWPVNPVLTADNQWLFQHFKQAGCSLYLKFHKDAYLLIILGISTLRWIDDIMLEEFIIWCYSRWKWMF